MPKPGRGADDIAKTVFGDAIREIAKALWQLSYAMFIFAGYLIFMVFVAPFGFGFATFVSAWSSRGGSYLSATIAVFTGILLEVFGFGIWIVIASWIFGNPVQYR